MKPFSRFFAILAVVSGLLAGGPAKATVLFEHTFGDPTTNSAWCTSCQGSFRVFDQFTLAADATISQIDARLWLDPQVGVEYSVWDTTMTTQLFAQTVALADLNLTSLGGTAYDVTAGISGLNLTAGTYMLSIYNPSSASVVAWFQNGLQGSSFQTQGGGGSDRQMSFRLVGNGGTAVPEPSALALCGLALFGVGVARKRAA